MFYFHESHRAELLAAKGKICKFIVAPSTDGKFFNIDEVLEVDGQNDCQVRFLMVIQR